MKLLNYTSRYFASVLLIIISIWAAIFYYAMLGEIYDSIDDGLDNQKGLIIQKATRDPNLLNKKDFEEGDYAIREIPAGHAINFRDTYIDSMMFMQNENSEEPVRLLKTVFKQNNRYYQLQVVTSMVEEDDLVKQLFYSLLWLYGGLAISIVLLNNYMLKKIWKPFYHLLRQIKNFRLDKPGVVETVESKIDEFRLLNDTVQKLLQNNIETYTSQKHFIENASHELQTPLANSINKLETFAEDPSLTSSQLALISNVLDNLERLTRLNKSLLLLSKIENRQFPDEREVNINEIIKKITEDFNDQSTYNKVEVTFYEKETCHIRMNADLAMVMLTNLVKNAIIYNTPGGYVHITITKDAVSVENTGVEHPLDHQKIFNRFHTGEPSPQSTGLGLSLVKAIASLYQFNVQYQFRGKHIITVKFPNLS